MRSLKSPTEDCPQDGAPASEKERLSASEKERHAVSEEARTVAPERTRLVELEGPRLVALIVPWPAASKAASRVAPSAAGESGCGVKGGDAGSAGCGGVERCEAGGGIWHKDIVVTDAIIEEMDCWRRARHGGRAVAAD